MKRYAWIRPAGPTNLSGFHQYEGHWLLQQAHRMHSYAPFSLSRSAGDCRRSFSGGGSAIDQVRLDRVVLLEELRHVDDQVANDRKARQGPNHHRLLAARCTRVMQARPLRPLMFIASEPHTPSRHDFLNVSVLSCALSRSITSSSM